MTELLAEKEKLRAEAIHEVEMVVYLLDEAEILASFTFALPIQIVTNYIFC